ncbi:hypothetical protein V1290_001389 [Bradyrhizobium sp. AZCC 1578]
MHGVGVQADRKARAERAASEASEGFGAVSSPSKPGGSSTM